MTATIVAPIADQQAIGENCITATGTIAVLPPSLLWAAAIFASRDSAKGVICSIDVRRTAENMIRISATDGHRLFKVVFPQSEQFFIAPEQIYPFRLNTKPFEKFPTRKVATVSLNSDGKADLQASYGAPVGACLWTAESHANAIGQDFPKWEQLWPSEDSLTCDPKEFVTFNAKYLADFCKMADKLTADHDNGVRIFTTDSAHRPCVFRARLDLSLLLCDTYEEEVMLESIIMPIIIRK